MNTLEVSLMQKAINICEEEDRSTAYLLQFMQSYAGVDHDTAVEFLLYVSKED